MTSEQPAAGDGKRLEKQIELEAGVDEVWEAVATGPGISAWFVPHDIHAPGADLTGAEAEADFGSGNVAKGRVLAWEPRRRVVFGGDEHGPPQALEFIVAAREGGGTVLRLVQSGVLGEDWEMEYHSRGWDVFFHNLASYLRHFRGRSAVHALVMGFTTLDATEAWDRYHAALGTSRELALGDQVTLAPKGVEPITGVVDLYTADTVLGIRTANSLYRFNGRGSHGWGMVNTFHYHYGTELEPAQWTQDWQSWLSGLFPPAEAPPAPASP